MSRVFLVRHAMPKLDPALGPAEWRLSAEGGMAARELRGRLPGHARRVASAERKAQETLELALAGTFEVDSRLNEVRRPVEPVGLEVRSVRRAWVAGRIDERHNGWETPTAAAARFDAGVRDHASGDVVVASHGMVLTTWLVSVGTLAAGEPAALFWEALGFPDIVEVEL